MWSFPLSWQYRLARLQEFTSEIIGGANRGMGFSLVKIYSFNKLNLILCFCTLGLIPCMFKRNISDNVCDFNIGFGEVVELLVVGLDCVAFGLLAGPFVGCFAVAHLDATSEKTFVAVVAVGFAFAVESVR